MATRSSPRVPARLERSSLVQTVYDELRAWIIDGISDEGTRVNIDALARAFDVSPTPVREALVRLEAEGFVIKEPTRGYSITPPLTLRELNDLFELRLLIEPWAAARVAQRRADDAAIAATLDDLARDVASFVDAPDDVDYASFGGLADHDDRFHTTILDVAGNPQVTAAFARTNCHLHLFRLSYKRGMGTEALAEHAAIVDALHSGVPDIAEAAMRTHLERSLGRFVESF